MKYFEKVKFNFRSWFRDKAELNPKTRFLPAIFCNKRFDCLLFLNSFLLFLKSKF